jgi:hypothetical protein
MHTGFWWGTGRKEKFGRHRRRRDDNSKIDPQEVGWGGTDWIAVIQNSGQVAGTCECGNEPSGALTSRLFLSRS